MRKVRVLLVALVMVAGGLAVGAPNALAYGPDHVYSLTFSLNCNDRNSPLCAPPAQGGFGLGGTWGWMGLDGTSTTATSGTFDGQQTFANHDPAAGPIGAQHVSYSDGSWTEMSGAAAAATGAFLVGTDPNNLYLVPAGVGVAWPVTPGHYSISFGSGIHSEATVTLQH
jgi:hypothetical protein